MKNENMRKIGVEVLDKFEEVESQARTKLRQGVTIDPGTNNTFTDTLAVQSAQRTRTAIEQSLNQALQEPAIARVVVENEEEERQVYYITRSSPPTNAPNMASYRAPIGRAASANLGEGFLNPKGETLYVIERTSLTPMKINAQWDSKDSVFEYEDQKPVTVTSLKSLIDYQPADANKPFDVNVILGGGEDDISTIVQQGRKRNILTKMELRDQPILDSFQDEIFRLPVNHKLMISGPPGTGKTTTLIRRLGQKLDIEVLPQEERSLLAAEIAMTSADAVSKWLMFTPTDLLKHYLKEAFAREGIPAPDYNVRTWKDFSTEHAKSTFGILRSSSSRRGFVFTEGYDNILKATLDQQLEWFEDFDQHQSKAFFEYSRRLSFDLRAIKLDMLDGLLKALGNIKTKTDLETTFLQIIKFEPAISIRRAEISKETDERIHKRMNQIINKDKSFLSDLCSLLTSLNAEIVEARDEDDDEDEETSTFDDDDFNEGNDEHPGDTNTGVREVSQNLAIRFLKRSMQAQARAAYRRQKLRKGSISSAVQLWLEDRSLERTDATEIGKALVERMLLGRLMNLSNHFFRRFPNRYRAFRRERSGTWYTELTNSQDINGLEIDLIMLGTLSAAHRLLGKSDVKSNLQNRTWASLRNLASVQSAQIYVDEATDFSPLQLSCMSKLSSTSTNSFFASGDFNQRLTPHGTRKLSELEWAVEGIKVREISVPYRQSRPLAEFANNILELRVKQEIGEQSLERDEVQPALLTSSGSLEGSIGWVADRIKEVERFLGELPTTAVFVNDDSQIALVAERLQGDLRSSNIKVEACFDGRILGQGQNVRVFSIDHIKGLEFEAVFFLSVDELAKDRPELFTKYLYVGATRAATYLGLTCIGDAPPPIKMHNQFVDHW